MFLNKKIDIRLTEIELKRIRKIVRKHKHLYSSESHFVRCAVIKLLTERERISDINLKREKNLVYVKEELTTR